MGIDPNKVEIVKSCLEASFRDVKPNPSKELFVFNDGKKSRELAIDRAFIDDFPISKLKDYLKSKVIPVLENNPDKRICMSKDGVKVVDRESN